MNFFNQQPVFSPMPQRIPGQQWRPLGGMFDINGLGDNVMRGMQSGSQMQEQGHFYDMLNKAYQARMMGEQAETLRQSRPVDIGNKMVEGWRTGEQAQTEHDMRGPQVGMAQHQLQQAQQLGPMQIQKMAIDMREALARAGFDDARANAMTADALQTLRTTFTSLPQKDPKTGQMITVPNPAQNAIDTLLMQFRGPTMQGQSAGVKPTNQGQTTVPQGQSEAQAPTPEVPYGQLRSLAGAAIPAAAGAALSTLPGGWLAKTAMGVGGSAAMYDAWKNFVDPQVMQAQAQHPGWALGGGLVGGTQGGKLKQKGQALYDRAFKKPQEILSVPNFRPQVKPSAPGMGSVPGQALTQQKPSQVVGNAPVQFEETTTGAWPQGGEAPWYGQTGQVNPWNGTFLREMPGQTGATGLRGTPQTLVPGQLDFTKATPEELLQLLLPQMTKRNLTGRPPTMP